MFILCDLKGQCLNHDHVAHVYEYMGAECSKLRQPMRTIFALSRAQLLLLVVTISRELSSECHVTKHKTQGVTSHCPISKIPGPLKSAYRALQVEGCAPNFLKKGRTIMAILCLFRASSNWMSRSSPCCLVSLSCRTCIG